MDRKTVLANLKVNLKWVENQLEAKRASEAINQATNIMIGCFQTQAQCRCDGLAWIDRRKGRRAALRNIRERYTTKIGNRALRQLLELTIAALTAATWIDTLWVGALPTPKEPMSKATRAKIAAAARKTHQKRAAERKRLEEAREARKSLEGTKSRPSSPKAKKVA